MILSNVNIGTGPSSGDGDPLRSAFATINTNFQTITNNVNALTNSVNSVAGRTGNVILTVNDIIGIGNYATNAAIVSANVGMKGYVDYSIQANISALVNAAPSTLDTIRELADAIGDDPNFAVNIALSVSSANTKMRSYVDGQITAANTASSTANVGIIGYINQANTIQTAYINGQITAANAGVTAANVGMLGYVNQANTTMKAYVDGQISAANSGASSYSNVNTQAYLITNSYATEAFVNTANTSLKVYTDGQITAANSAVTAANLGVVGYVDNAVSTANIGIIGYIDQANTIQNGEITAANVGMKGYVDSLTYSQISNGTSNVKIAASGGNVEFNVNGATYGTLGSGVVTLGYRQYPHSGNSSVIAIGTDSGLIGQKNYAIGIGVRAGWVSQGQYSVAIGYDAGKTSQVDNSIAINASGLPLDTTTAGLYINPVRQDDSNVANIVYYNTSTKEMTYGPAVGSTYGNVQVATYLPTHTGNVQAGNVKAVTAYRFATGAVTITNDDSHVVLNPDTGTNAVAGVKVGGGGYILGPNASRCITLNYGSIGGAVGLQANVTIGTGGSGNLVVLGRVTAGNITANYISGDGSAITSLSGAEVSGNVAEASLAYSVNISPVFLNQEYHMAILPAKEGAYGVKAADGTANVTYNPVQNRLTVNSITTGNISAGNVFASGTSGKIGHTNGGFVQQITANSNGVSLNTVTGNIQLMNLNLGVNSLHTVAFSNNKLEETDMILVSHHSGGVMSVAVGAYYFSSGTALIWIRNISGADTGNFTPMLKFAIIKAPGS